jgi:hypothetical protein
MSTLDDILDDHHAHAFESTKDTKAAIKSLMVELVGEDEPLDPTKNFAKQYKEDSRNQLRNELRKKVSEL